MQQRIKKFLVNNKIDLLQAGLALVILALSMGLLVDFGVVTGKKKSVFEGISKVTVVLGSVTLISSSAGLFLTGGMED